MLTGTLPHMGRNRESTNMVWSDELRTKVGLSRASLLRKLSPVEGEIVLSGLGLTREEITQALEICKKPKASPVTIVINDPSRKIWLVAAWLLGASWRQLAILHGIAHTSVMQSARKAITSKSLDYRAMHTKNKIPFERLEIMRRIFLENKDKFANMDPSDVAIELDNLAVYED